MQAGASERGRQFAARWAEIVFAAQRGKPEMQAFYTDLKGRLPAHGRTPEQCAILVEVSCVIGETEAIAQERADFVNGLLDDELALATTSAGVGVDMSRFDGKGDIKALQGNQGMQGSVDYLEQIRAAENLTVTQAAKRRAASQLVGTAQTIADQLEDLFVSGACDGFVVSPVVAPLSHEAFCRSVVPELQRRGLFRRAYQGKTLRDHIAETS